MKAILMHGMNTDPDGKWYPWFRDEVLRLGYEFHAPALPDSQDPDVEVWKQYISDLLPDDDTVLIGHSRGGVAILRWLEEQPANLKIKKVILIAVNSGFVYKRAIPDETNHGFYTEDGYDFDKIRQHCDDFVVLHSKDDQWVPYEAGVENANGLHARLLTFENRGHFGKGVNKVPELIKELK